jgi:hypothetical protein
MVFVMIKIVRIYISRIGFCLLLIFPYMHACAQFNDTTHYYINYSSAGSINETNNSRSYLLSNAIRYTMKFEKIRFNTVANYLYGEQE